MYIHYGTSEYNPDLYKPISNAPYMPKPFAGFWCSAIDAPYGWWDWVLDNAEYIDFNLDTHICLNVSDKARVLVIDSLETVLALYELYPLDTHCISWCDKYAIYLDWEQIALDYDAVEVSISSDGKLYRALYGWDCDSMVIFNPSIIEVVA